MSHKLSVCFLILVISVSVLFAGSTSACGTMPTKDVDSCVIDIEFRHYQGNIMACEVTFASGEVILFGGEVYETLRIGKCYTLILRKARDYPYWHIEGQK